jgi:hypothetical protein
MQNGQHHIVVEDLTGDFWEGAIVDAAQAAILASHGVTLLPVDPTLFHLSAVGGYFKRAWGAGWPLPSHPGLVCPMLMFVTQRHQMIRWAARLVRNVDAEKTDRFTGQIRITPDTTQALAQRPGFAADEREPAFDLSMLGAERPEGGWIVRGSARVFSPNDGYLGLGLYGAGPGLRVAWAAVSLV